MIPKWRGYALRQALIDLGNGAEAHSLAKVLLNELEEWDATHDAVGRLRNTTASSESDLGEKKVPTTTVEV